MKLSVLIDSNDLGNSVRRVVGRMFSDDVLTNYSLFGIRKKENFSSLASYHVVIGNNILKISLTFWLYHLLLVHLCSLSVVQILFVYNKNINLKNSV